MNKPATIREVTFSLFAWLVVKLIDRFVFGLSVRSFVRGRILWLAGREFRAALQAPPPIATFPLNFRSDGHVALC